jgi:hypothetical protein
MFATHRLLTMGVDFNRAAMDGDCGASCGVGAVVGSRTQKRGEYRCQRGLKKGSCEVLRITGEDYLPECRASSKRA